MSMEAPEDLVDWCNSQGLLWDDVSGLILNSGSPISKRDAMQLHSKWALRWRYRIDEHTGDVFDILQGGCFYSKDGI